METTVKGVFLKSLVETVRAKKGNEGVKQLEKEFGSLDFSAFQNYPLTEQARLNKAASIVLFGSHTPEAEYEFGRLSFKTYADSIIGKTMFSLIGDDPLKVASALPKILNMVTSGLDIEVKAVGPIKVSLRMKNLPFHIKHYEGCCAAAAEHFGHTAVIESKVWGKNDYEYIVEWK